MVIFHMISDPEVKQFWDLVPRVETDIQQRPNTESDIRAGTVYIKKFGYQDTRSFPTRNTNTVCVECLTKQDA